MRNNNDKKKGKKFWNAAANDIMSAGTMKISSHNRQEQLEASTLANPCTTFPFMKAYILSGSWKPSLWLMKAHWGETLRYPRRALHIEKLFNYVPPLSLPSGEGKSRSSWRKTEGKKPLCSGGWGKRLKDQVSSSATDFQLGLHGGT